MEITVLYRASDGFKQTRKFKTLKGAQNYAQNWVGKHPEIGGGYAVSFDGVGTVYCSGCSLLDLFPPDPPAEKPERSTEP